MKQLWRNVVGYSRSYVMSTYSKSYSSKPNSRDLREMILRKIENRAKDYPLRALVPVAREVLKSRMLLIQGVSTLIQVVPLLSCKFCSQVYVGEQGHLIQDCKGYRRKEHNQVHEWVPGTLKDVIVPVETFHLTKMFQEIKHDQRFDFDRIPAVVELCWQAGADPNDGSLHADMYDAGSVLDGGTDRAGSFSEGELRSVANGTLRAWETLRLGVQKLMMAYPVRVCKHCSEVHVGMSGHKARLCGMFKYETWRGSHFWKKAAVDDLVPPKVSWIRRSQDPPVLLDEWKGFYGHAPAVVDLCSKAGAIVPNKYFLMIKENGLPEPANIEA